MLENLTKVGSGPIEWITPDSLSSLKKLWDSAGVELPPLEALPPTGVLYQKDKACLFAYRTNSSVVILEALVFSPEIRRKQRTQAFEGMVLFLEQELRSFYDHGPIFFTAFLQSSRVLERAQSLNYQSIGVRHGIAKRVE